MFNKIKLKKLLDLLLVSESIEEIEMIGHYMNLIVVNNKNSHDLQVTNNADYNKISHKQNEIDNLVDLFLSEKKIDPDEINKKISKGFPGEKNNNNAPIAEFEIKEAEQHEGNKEILAEIVSIISEITGNNSATIDCDLSLREYYGMDSLAEIELLNLIEKRLNIKLGNGFLLDHRTINEIINGLGELNIVKV